MDRGACRAIVHGMAKSQTRLSDYYLRYSQIMTYKEIMDRISSVIVLPLYNFAGAFIPLHS